MSAQARPKLPELLAPKKKSLLPSVDEEASVAGNGKSKKDPFQRKETQTSQDWARARHGCCLLSANGLRLHPQ